MSEMAALYEFVACAIGTTAILTSTLDGGGDTWFVVLYKNVRMLAFSKSRIVDSILLDAIKPLEVTTSEYFPSGDIGTGLFVLRPDGSLKVFISIDSRTVNLRSAAHIGRPETRIQKVATTLWKLMRVEALLAESLVDDMTKAESRGSKEPPFSRTQI